MSFDRSIPAGVRGGLEAENAPDALLAFLTLTHPALVVPLRVVSDVLDYVWAGETFTGIPFGFRQLSDDENGPTTQISLQNVDRTVGEILRALSGRAVIRLDLLSSADFDLSVVPRTATGTPSAIYGFQHFELIDVTVTPLEITGTVFLRDYGQEPWPGVRATQSRLPGLYR